MDFNKKKEVLSQYNIDPYSYLDVDHDCIKEELDQIYKHRLTQTTNINELKLLKQCYKIVLNDVQSNSYTANARSTDDRFQSNLPGNFKGNFKRPVDFHRTDFTDSNNRQSLFVNDTLNFEEFQRNLGRKPTSREDPEPTERLFVNQQFDLKKFNDHFENKYAFEEENTEIHPLDSSTGMAFMPICTYNGLIIEDHEPEAISFDNPKPSSSKKRQKVKEENVSKLFAQKSSEQIKVDTSKNFKDIDRIMEQDHLNKMKSQLEYNKNKVLKHLSIYPENIINDFMSQRLDDSSTCIDKDRLVTPKGIRRRD